MSTCPGYLSVTITDKTSSTTDDQLFNHDLLVSCPFPDFNTTFFFPIPTGQGPRTFEVRLHDTKHLHRFHVTSDEGPRSPCSSFSGTLKDTLVHVEGPSDVHSPHPVSMGVAFVVAVCSLVAYVVVSLTRRNFRGCEKPDQSGNEIPISSGGRLSPRGRTEFPQRGGRTCGGRVKRLLVVTYVLLRLLYNFLFAFSAFYVLLTVCLERHLVNLERSIQRNSTLTETLHHRLTQEAAEQLRLSLTRGCCGGQPFESVTVFLEPPSSTNREVLATGPRSSTAWNKNLADYGAELRRFLGEFRRVFEGRLDRVMRNFSRVLRSSLRNNWLVFPQSLFNGTLGPTESTADAGPGFVESGGGSSWEVDFALFLGIAEAESVEEWRRELWNRLEAFGF